MVVSAPVGSHWMSGRILVAERTTCVLGAETAVAVRKVADIVIRLRRVLIPPSQIVGNKTNSPPPMLTTTGMRNREPAATARDPWGNTQKACSRSNPLPAARRADINFLNVTAAQDRRVRALIKPRFTTRAPSNSYSEGRAFGSRLTTTTSCRLARRSISARRTGITRIRPLRSTPPGTIRPIFMPGSAVPRSLRGMHALSRGRSLYNSIATEKNCGLCGRAAPAVDARPPGTSQQRTRGSRDANRLQRLRHRSLRGRMEYRLPPARLHKPSLQPAKNHCPRGDCQERSNPNCYRCPPTASVQSCPAESPPQKEPCWPRCVP